jgi:hypothetical protein
MGVLQENLERVIHTSFSEDAMLKAVIRKAFRARKIELNDGQLAEILASFKGATDATGFGTSVTVDGGDGEVNLIMTSDDFKNALDQFMDDAGKGIEAGLAASLETMPQKLLESVYDHASESLRCNRLLARGFTRRLRQRWGRGFTLLEILIDIARESGQGLLADLQKESGEPTDTSKDSALIDVLFGLHVRACRMASEVLCLMCGGFSEGANARWRSLHEVAVIAMFISQRQGDLPERYLRHAAVERCRAARQYQQHCAVLGHEPLQPAELDALEKEMGVAISDYGTPFGHDYGWAADALKLNKPTFSAIEQHVNLDHWHPYYRMACHSIHAGSQSLFWSLSIPRGNDLRLLAGASDAGMADPGHCTALSLCIASASLLTLEVNIDFLMACRVMQLLSKDIGEVLLEAHDSLQTDIEARRR